MIEMHGILRSPTTPSPLAGLILGVRRLTVQNFVPVRCGCPYYPLVQHPSGDHPFFRHVGLSVQPLPAGLKDNDFATTLDLPQFGGTPIRREVDRPCAHHGAALGGSSSDGKQYYRCYKNQFRLHDCLGRRSKPRLSRTLTKLPVEMLLIASHLPQISASICGSMFPPLITATFIVVFGNSSRWNRNAATATAPLGSATVFGSATRRRMASRISSSLTVTMSSTYRRMCSKLISPTLCVRNPSAMVRVTCSALNWMILPERRLAWASPASSGSAPITFTAGLLSLIAVAIPLIIPPPPTGTRTVSTSGRSSRISSPIVPWPAMIFSSLYGGTIT